MSEVNNHNKIKQLKQILTTNRGKMPLIELKDNVLIKDNMEILDDLIKIILKDLNSISHVNNSNDYEWLYFALKYVFEIIYDDSKSHTLEVLENLKKIKNSLETKRSQAKRSVPNNIKIFYTKMLDTINPLIKFLDKKTSKLKKKKEEQISSTNLYKFTSKLIFEFKNFDYLFQLSRICPNMINCTDEKNCPIISLLIKKQIQNIKRNSNSQRKLYFYRVINLITNANEFYLTNQQYNEILSYLKNELNNIEKDKDNEELLLFINDLISTLKSKSKVATLPKNIRELYKKYNINEIDDNYLCDILKNKPKNNLIVDYTDKLVFTLDMSNHVRIFDDAISCEFLPNGNYLVSVYIADVASIVPYGSEIDLLCYNRAETIYLNDHVIDMLPLNLAYHCSLNTKGEKRVVAYTFEFTQDMELYDFKIENAMIKVKANLTFNGGQKLYYSNYKSENEIGKMLKLLINFNKQFSESNFYDSNYHLFKEEIRKLSGVHEHHGDNDCSFLIASLMILINRSMAKFFFENGYPFLYRVNDSNIDTTLINKLKSDVKNQVLPHEIIKQLDKVYSRSRYSDINTGHNGLKLDHYCHTTNPIRSYASLFTQRMIVDEFINGGLNDDILKQYEGKIPIIANNLNTRIDLDDNFREEYNKIQKKFTRK